MALFRRKKKAADKPVAPKPAAPKPMAPVAEKPKEKAKPASPPTRPAARPEGAPAPHMVRCEHEAWGHTIYTIKKEFVSVVGHKKVKIKKT